MRRDIFQIIEVTRKLKMRVYLLSNASLITKEYAQILSDLKITEFSTTIFSMDETINDSITLKKGSLKMVLQGLENLKRNNIEVLIKTPVMQKNVINITDVKNFCDKNGFRYFASALIMGKSDGDQSTKNLRVKSCDFPNLVNKIDKLSGNREEEKHNVAVPCKPLHYSFSIDCKGNVYPCNSFYYKVGNIFNKSIYEIWYHSKEMEFIRDLKNSDLEKCNDCALYRYCDRCPGIVYQENKDMISCDQYAKSVAKVRMNNEISRQK
ncbi:hypothetical protein FACS1894193_01000 [Bacilli bacterium]|nr:hypothetical protein FACS1894193_01000 [Bacilli bacterium]